MSSKFSARFAKELRKLKMQGEIVKPVPKDLIPKPWVVYAKQAFGSPHSVVEYLGRYTHRVAISNARIVKITQTDVTFSWCDRKNNYQKKTQTIDGVEFLERFIDHIVPPYFRRIRYLGFLSTRNKRKSIEQIREYFGVKTSEKQPILTRAQVLAQKFGERSVLNCNSCGGELVLFKSYQSKRAPPIDYTKALKNIA